ncbi:MAG: PKD domain-containing protein [Psychroflexus halocasei]
MNKITIHLKVSITLMFFLNICFAQGTFAQTGFTLQWDSEVGCLTYDDDRKEKPLEDLDDGECITACENSTINFKLLFNEQLQDVARIDWESDGGVVSSVSSDETEASIDWPTAMTNGEVTVKITMTNGEVIYNSLCINVKPKPVASYETANSKESGFYCSQTDIYFDNLSYTTDGSQIVHSVWRFGDGNYSSEENPIHSYEQPGVYRVDLTVYDECGCSDTYTTEIKVTEPSFEISCPTVTCEGAIETYTLDINPYARVDEIKCENYKWFVEGGEIVEQGEDWVDVLWNNVGEDGFGYLYFDQNSCDVECNNILAVRVPVVTTEGIIQGGKKEICKGEQSRYSLPQWPTTDFEWDLFDSSGTIYPDATILVDQRNEIAVDSQGLPEGIYTLRANYTNTLLGCGGQAEYKIHVFENLEIDNHVSSICEGDQVSFSTINTATNTNWTISQYGNQIYTGAGSSLDYSFAEPGRYKITAEAPGFCSDVSYVEVYEIPSVEHIEISGPDIICPGESNTYAFIGNTNGFDIEWQVNNGVFQGPSNGETVSVVFDESNTNYEVSVRLVNPGLTECVSNTVVKPIQKFEVTDEIVSLTHNSSEPQEFCTSSLSDFSIAYADTDTYKWTITPAELGAVSTGQGTANPTILFNEVTNGIYNGTISVEANVCGKMEVIDTFDFNLTGSPIITAQMPNDICAEEAFDINITSNIPMIVNDPNTDMILSFNNGQGQEQIITGGIQNSPTSYTFQNVEIDNVDNNISLGYEVQIINESCNTAIVTGNMTVLPAPIVEISSQNGDTFCDVNEINTIFTANTQNGSTFQWFYNNNPITGANSPVLNLGSMSNAGFGSYYVEVTGQNDCVTKSRSKYIYQECAQPPLCNGDEIVYVTGQWDSCGVIQLNGSYTGTPDEVTFKKFSLFTVNNAALIDGTSDVLHTYAANKPGIYSFVYEVKYNDCVYKRHVEVEVGYQAELNYEIECTGSAFDISMYNDSPFLESFTNISPTYEIVNTATNAIITPVTNSGNDNEALATAVPPGNYDLTLSIQQPGYPSCEITKNVNLQLPDASFSINPMAYCSDESVILSPDYIDEDNFSYTWIYQGKTNLLTQITPNFNLDDNGIVTLIVESKYGCSDSMTITGIEVFEPTFSGEIKSSSATNTLCESSSLELFYNPTPGSAQPSAFSWYHEGTEIQGASSSSIAIDQPGLYTVWLYDANGCSYQATDGIYINEALPPTLNAEITQQICVGDSLSLTGYLSPDNAEYRVYFIENNGNTLLQPWTTGPEVMFTDTPTQPGNHSYLVEYRDLNTGCLDSQIFTTKVFSPTSIGVDYELLSCEPYRIRVFATNVPSVSGLLTWSNGEQGDEIIVEHGGPFRVNFQPNTDACNASATVNVPKSPEEYMWIFPDGCFEYCPSKRKINPYIIGPIPEFYKYGWSLNGQTLTGGGQVSDYIIEDLSGSLNLFLYNELCAFTTDPLIINYGRECDRYCRLEPSISNVEIVTDGPYTNYHVTGSVPNPNNYPVSLSLNSENGTYIPSYISIPANSTYYFNNSNPLIFIPDTGFMGGVDLIEIDMRTHGRIICQDEFHIDYPSITGPPVTVNIVASPNPVTSFTEIAYSFDGLDASDFKGAKLQLYNISGHLQSERNLKAATGVERFDFTHLSMGQYVLVFSYQGKNIAQKILIKK